MPTGYTATLMEKGQSFPEFVMTCARAFGALFEMRDDPPYAKIPDAFQPSEYHTKRIEECKKKIAQLSGMSAAQKVEYAQKLRDDAIARANEYIRREAEENQRIDAMIERVNAWTPPSNDHANLKEFMLQQLSISKHDSTYWMNELAKFESSSPMRFWRDELSEAHRSLEYNEVEAVKDAERAASRTNWVRQLRESLPMQEVA